MNDAPTRTTAEWQAADAAHYLHPFTDFQTLAAKGSRVIVSADNIYLRDSEGARILDAMSGLWCVNVGYGRTELIEAATRQLSTLPFYNSFFQTATPPAIELAEQLAEVSPSQFQHVFFSGSGSEGNDTVVRMVRRYWDLLGQPERHVIISRKNAYHGSTMAGASLGGMSGMHEQGGLPIPGIVHIEQPFWFGLDAGARSEQSPAEEKASRDAFGLEAAGWLEAKILELGAEKVAAFIGEPVQGAGGVIVPPDTYWPEIQRICDRHGVLLVSDEVICGFGRIGQWFGCEHFGFSPDLMTFAKGVTSGYVPLGGVMVGERIARVLIDRGGEFNHGYTYSGHPVACAVGIANLRLLQHEGIVKQVREVTGPYLAAQFAQLRNHPLVGEVQTCGLMGAVQLVKDKARGTVFPSELGVGMLCRGHCFGNGLIMRAVGDRMIVAPPLVITRAQIDEMMGLMRRCLDLTLADVTRQASNKQMSTDAAFLQIRDIEKEFSGHKAVDRVSIDIAKGEIFALLGSSGCGKTTLLRMLAGFETPTAGSILLDGKDLAGLPPYERPLNMMFQSYALFPHLSARDNIAFGLRRDRLPATEIAQRVDAMLKLVQLEKFGQRKPHQLSGGQQQRVALARSLAKRPQLLLLDEPLGALDKKLREETQIELVNIIHEVGVTCVMVTHDQEEAMTMASRIAVMSEGRFLQVGAPGEIYENPANRFVADFIGNVNLMDGVLIEDEPSRALVRCADCTHLVEHGITGTEGMKVTVALRPEKIRIERQGLAAGAAGGVFNQVRGIVKDMAYFGGFTVYHLLLPSGATLKVSASNSERHREHAIGVGDAAWASWSGTAQVVLMS